MKVAAVRSGCAVVTNTLGRNGAAFFGTPNWCAVVLWFFQWRATMPYSALKGRPHRTGSSL